MSTVIDTKPSDTKPSLTIKRRYNVPPARVFQAWTYPQKMKRWMGGDGFGCKLAEGETKVGGRYRIIMQKPGDPEEHDVSGVYREVVVNEKLVFTWAWRTTPERESLVTITFKPDGAGTLMTLTHEQFFDEAARDRHNQGWVMCLSGLESYLGAA